MAPLARPTPASSGRTLSQPDRQVARKRRLTPASRFRREPSRWIRRVRAALHAWARLRCDLAPHSDPGHHPASLAIGSKTSQTHLLRTGGHRRPSGAMRFEEPCPADQGRFKVGVRTSKPLTLSLSKGGLQLGLAVSGGRSCGAAYNVWTLKQPYRRTVAHDAAG